MTKNILLSMVMISALSLNMTMRADNEVSLDDALSAAEQAVRDAYEAGHAAGLKEGLEVGVDVTDTLDDNDKQFNGGTIADETMDMKKMLENPEEMEKVMKDPEFQKFLKELENDPKMAAELAQATAGMSDSNDNAEENEEES